MNSGGAHCLKYGVTTNNLLGVRLVTLDGEILDLGGPAMDARRLRLARPRLRLRRPARNRDRSDGAPHSARRKGARPVLFGFDSAEDAEPVRRLDHRRWHRSGGDGIHGQARDPYLREFRPRRLPARCRGDADHRGRGQRSRDAGDARPNRGDRQGAQCAHRARIDVGDGERPDLEGPQIGLRRDGTGRRLHLHGWDGADRPAAGSAAAAPARFALRSGSGSPMSFMPATATCIR